MVENFTELLRGEKRKIRNVSDELSQLLDLTAVDPHVGFFLQAMKGGIHLLQKSHQKQTNKQKNLCMRPLLHS